MSNYIFKDKGWLVYPPDMAERCIGGMRVGIKRFICDKWIVYMVGVNGDHKYYPIGSDEVKLYKTRDGAKRKANRLFEGLLDQLNLKKVE